MLALLTAALGLFALPGVAQAGVLEDIAAFFGFGAAPANEEVAPAAVDTTKEADNSSIATWEGVARDNTENIGRIWTDKTVNTDTFTLPTSSQGKTHTIDIGDSDFLVTLSALSSASNTVASSSKPLDIVLVMDASGSMDEPLSGGTSRIDALRDAASSFVKAIAEQNASISDVSKQHQVSLVKFASNKSDSVGNDTYWVAPFTRYNYSQVMKTLSPCTSSTLSSFTQLINAINPGGGTYANYGMQLAESQLSSSAARSDAQKVVIFFTDGQPGASGFDGSVANGAVTAAHNLKKEEGALVYSVGVFSGADPNGNSNANSFMNAVSSNYPNATAYNHLGDRDLEGNYYKTATTAEELNNIFAEIQEEIGQKAQFPTETTEGAAGTSGYITFTDTLGKYMYVDSFKPIVFADEEFTLEDKQTNGNVDTYIYEGEVSGSELYPNGNVNQILITVTRSDDMSVGDTVEVKVPAGLIPLRYFDVDSKDAANPTMTIKEAFPIRITYGVSVKPGVLEPTLNEDGTVAQAAKIANPDNAMSEYLKANTADGKARFYSNLYSGNKSLAGETIGDTVASFTPASGNSFYYFTSDTQLFHDAEMTDSVKGNETIQDDVTYYYNRPYWQWQEGDKAEYIAKNPIAIDAKSGLSEDHLKTDDEGVKCIIGGMQHISRIYELHLNKTDVPAEGQGSNVTGTADTVVNPDWAATARNINVALGNNGRLSADIPGTLEISKSTVIPAGFETNLGNTSFEMVVTSAAMANKSVDAVVKNANGEIQGGYFKLAFGADGVAKHFIKNGETLHVYGMANGADYKVEETAVEGFTQTKAEGTTGTIAANASAKVAFENTYGADPIEVTGADNFKGVKILSGRDWVDEDKFGFVMQATNDLAKEVLPNEMTATVDADAGTPQSTEVPFNFGNIEFSKPGIYEFQIFEREADSTILGNVTASLALYKVTVTVTDNGKGVLSPDVKMTKTANDVTTDTSGVPADVATATFTNTYSTDGVDGNLVGTKHYIDMSGNRPNTGNMFHFRVTALDGADGYGPMPAGSDNNQIVVTDQGGVEASINFAAAKFESSMAGHSYTYKVEEVIDVDGAWVPVADAITPTDGKYVRDGMTYDANAYKVTVTVELQDDGTIKAVASYPNGTTQLDFYNEYKPEALVLGDDTNTAIKGTKTLTGRDMLENETFDFTLSATNDVVAGGYTIADDKASVSGATNGTAKEFSFGDVTFTKPGKYVFNIIESGYNGSDTLPNDGSLKFDRHTCTVTVNVVDNNSKLELAADNGIVYSDGTEAAFSNSYTASLNLTNGVKVSKTLTGRDMLDGESFGFTVAAAEGDAAAAAKLVDADKSFTVSGAKKDVPNVVTALSNLKFNQADANKTFTFVITENTPAENPSNGVTYNVDGQQYTVAITVIDNGNGSMKAKTAVTDVNGDKVWEGDLAAAAMTNDEALPFKNSYQANPATSFTEGRLGGNKVLSGRDWLESDSFTFTLTGEGNASMPESVNSLKLTAEQVKALSNGTLEGTNNRSFAFNFGNITYNAVGEYDYSIVEENKGTIVDGIAYSNNTLKLHVSVTDPGDGQLVAKVTRTSAAGTRTFTNTYSAGVDEYGTAANVAVTKQVKNHAWTADQFAFTAQPADQDSATKIGRDNADEFEFNFENGGDANAVVEMPILSDLQFKQNESGKTYSYTFKEEQGNAAGYTYDGTTYQLDITPNDLSNGKMSITTKLTTKPAEGEETVQAETWNQGGKPADFKIAFVNTYEAVTTDADGAVKVEANKTLTGRDMVEGEFNFAIALKDAAQDGLADVATGTNGADGKIAFSAINYKASELDKLAQQDNSGVTKNDDGTWTVSYVAYEKAPAAGSGVTQDKTTFEFTVTVTDDGDGTLSTQVNLPTGDGATTFTNEYGKDASAAAEVSATKTLTGRPQKDGEFTFTVAPDADNAQVIATGKSTAGADGVATGIDFDEKTDGVQNATFEYTFASLKQAVADDYATYDANTKTWTVNYVMAEDVINLPGGVTVTEGTQATQKFSVTVTDNGDGTLMATSPTALVFSNAYGSSVPEDSEITLDGKFKKVFEGRDWTANDKFTFKIEALTDGAPMPDNGNNTVTVAGDADGKTNTKDVNFGKISFDFDDIKDADPNADGVRTKTFEYKVTEDIPQEGEEGWLPGVTYDGHTAKLTITLTDNGKGELTGSFGEIELMAVANVDNGTFTNVYKSELDYGVAGGLTIEKTLSGRDMMAGQFQFTMTAEDEASAKLFGFDGMSKVFDSPAGTNGEPAEVAKLVPAATFTQDNAGAKYEYTLEETKKGGDGYTNDSTVHTVVIEVIDNNNGTMTAKTTIDGKSVEYTTGAENADKAVVSFENSYTAGPVQLEGEGGASLEATKTLTGRDMKAGEFGFTVYNNKDEVVATGSNTAAADGQAGKITFEAIKYTSDSLYQDVKAGKATASEPDADGKITYTYNYTVKETSGVVDGVTATKGAFTVTVKVTDNNDGTLSIAVDPIEGGMAFTNAYGEGKGGTSTISASGRKSYEHADGLNAPDIAGKYTFTLTGSEGAPMPEKTEATNDASGNVNFGTIAYTMQNVFGDSGQKADAETDETAVSEQTDLLASDEAPVDEGAAPAKSEARTKTFTYTVKESGNVAGVSTDSDKTFTVTVTDDGMGHLTAKSSAGEGAFLFDFTNTYSVQPLSYDVTAALNATKTLTGRAMTAGEFAFQVVEVVDGQDVVVSKGTNGAAENGQAASVTFDAIMYTEPGVHTYKVSEAGGEAGGVAYDSSSYVVTVTVKDNGDGTLSAETVVKDDAKLAFANKYVAAPTDLQFNGLKKLDGRELAEGEFTFELREDGKVIQTVTNGADGAVPFSPVTFNEVGEHHYEIAEVKGDVEGMTYDDTVYTYDVVVTDNGEGRLVATWTAGENGSAVIFRNSYVAPVEPAEPTPTPEPPAPEVPETGDRTNAALPVAIALAGAAVVSAAWVTSRRHKN